MRIIKLLSACCIVVSMTAGAHAQAIDWAKIDGIFGRAGAVSGTAHRYGFPRSDLQVTLDGITIRPTLALGGWVAFQPMGNTAMVMVNVLWRRPHLKNRIRGVEAWAEITAPCKYRSMSSASALAL